MVTPAQKEKDGKAAYKWRRLVTTLSLTEDAEWETICDGIADWRLENEALRVEINRLRAELTEARAGYLVPAFLQPDLPERVA